MFQSSFGYPWAVSFTPAGDFTFTELDLALGWVAGTNSATVALMSDAGGVPGTTTYQSWNIAIPAFALTCCGNFVTLLASGPPASLVSGTSLWVAVFPGSADTVIKLER
jgi:hypothetical protein